MSILTGRPTTIHGFPTNHFHTSLYEDEEEEEEFEQQEEMYELVNYDTYDFVETENGVRFTMNI